MFLIAKVIGLILVVGIPTTIGGAQLYLKNKTISTAQKEVVQAIQKTAASLKATKENFNKEITRITTEKNELITTKAELTYVPVVIKTNIEAMDDAKTAYETQHKSLQESITAKIATHKSSVTAKKLIIEGLWTTEKDRVEKLKDELDKKIAAVKTENQQLQTAIDTAKASIEETINKVFHPATP